jgi:hypothetical protein
MAPIRPFSDLHRIGVDSSSRPGSFPMPLAACPECQSDHVGHLAWSSKEATVDYTTRRICDRLPGTTSATGELPLYNATRTRERSNRAMCLAARRTGGEPAMVRTLI